MGVSPGLDVLEAEPGSRKGSGGDVQGPGLLYSLVMADPLLLKHFCIPRLTSFSLIKMGLVYFVYASAFGA